MIACAAMNVVGFGNDVNHAYENYRYWWNMQRNNEKKPGVIPHPFEPHQCTFWDLTNSEIKVERRPVPVTRTEQRLVIV